VLTATTILKTLLKVLKKIYNTIF